MLKISTDREKINNLLTRGVEEIIDRQELEKKLLSGRQLRVKLGIDPTSPNLHLGRSIPLLKLRDFQELGHKAILIIGNFTGTIGDSSDKDSERPMISEEQVKKNLKQYTAQAAKIINIKKCKVYYNSDWLKKLGYSEIGKQANQFSVNEFISRENIKKRLNQGKRVSLREVLYPLMQGYDSVAVKADVEIGGTDQRFNLLAGRQLQKEYGQKQQDIVMGPLVAGLDGRKMSSSWQNTIDFNDQPNDMYGKVMSLQDNLIIKYFSLLTRIDTAQIEKYKKLLQSGENPKNVKVELGKEIVTLYYNKKLAESAAKEFEKVFFKKEDPSDMPLYELKNKKVFLPDFLLNSSLLDSKSEAKRKITEGAVKINGKKVMNWEIEIELKSDDIIQVGKRKFLKIK